MRKIKKTTAFILCILTLFSALSLSSFAAVKPLKPEMLTVTETTADSVTLTWLPSEGAIGYRIYTYLGGKWKIVKDTTATYAKLTGLYASKSYIFAVRSATKVLGNIYFCDGYSHVTAKTKALGGTTVTGSAGLDYVDLNWARVPGATGYAVYQHMGSGWKLLGTVKKPLGRVKNLKSATSYYFAVRAYTEGDGKAVQGPASNFFNIKTGDPNKVKVACGGVSDSALKLNWSKANSATGYRIYAYLNGSWKPVKDIMNANTLTHTFKNLNSDTEYYLRVRAFTIYGSTVVWYEPSDICKAVTNPGINDVYVYRIDDLRNSIRGDSFTLSYKTVDAKYGDIPVTIAKKGDSYYLHSKVNEMPYTLLNDETGAAYIILDEITSYIKVPDIATAAFDVKAAVADLLPGDNWSSKASVATFNSQKVVCESFTNPLRTKMINFYYKTGKLVGIDEVGLFGLEGRAFVSSISNSSDDSLFSIPDGYSRLFYAAVEDLPLQIN